MPDVGIGTLISGGASIVGGLLSGSGSKQAAQTQAQAGQSAINAQEQMFQQNRADLAPYRDVGTQGLYTLADYLGISTPASLGATTTLPGGQNFDQALEQYIDKLNVGTKNAPMEQLKTMDPTGYAQQMQLWRPTFASMNNMDLSSQKGPETGSLLKPFSFDISQDPGYQFRLGQGEQAITNRASATGGVSGGGDLSGATLKELLRYGQDYASGEYNAAFQRDQATKAQQFGMLSGVAGMGSGATTTGVQAGQQTAAGIGNTLTGIGNAQAAGQVGQANALGGALSNIGSGVNQAMLLRSIMGNPGVNQVNQGVNLAGSSTLDPSLMAG